MNRDQVILKCLNQSDNLDSQAENVNPETEKPSQTSKNCGSFPSCLYQSSSRSLESSDEEEEEDTKSTSSTRSPSDQGIFSSSADISSTDSSDEVNSSSSTSSVSHDGILFSRNKQMSSSSPSICHSLHLLSSHRRSVLSNNIVKTRKTNRPGSWTGSSTNLKIMDIASDDEEEDLHVYDFGTSSRVESDEDDVSHRFQAEEEEEDYHDKTKYTEKEKKVMQVKSAEPVEDHIEISAESVLTTRKSVGKKSLASDSFISMQSPLDHLHHQLNHQQEQQENSSPMIKKNMSVNHYSSSSPSAITSDLETVDSCLLDNYYSSYISNKHSNEVLINGKPVDMTSEQYAVLTFDQVVRLDQVMDSRMQIHGRGNFPTLEVKLKDLVQVVKNKLIADGVSVRDIRLNGGAASHVLISSRDVKQHTYTDLDLIFGVELCNHKTFDKVRTAVLDSLVDFLPEGVNRKKMSTCTLKEAYVHKMVKVIEGGDKWSLISLSNNTGRDIEIKFVDTMKRQFEFSVDSFQIILDSLLLFYECQSLRDSRARIMTENIYPTVVGESVYGNFSEAMTHLQRRMIATRNPEQIRGGGLLKYCRLGVLGYKPVKYDEIKSMEKYMCSRFFIDFSDITVQRMKLANYLNTHFHDDQVKYDYLMILQKVVDESTVCLMGHERRQTLSLIDEFASYFYFPYSFMSNVHHHEKQQQQQKTVSSGSHPMNEPVSYSSHPNKNLPGSSSPSVETASSSQANNNIQQNSLQFSGLNSTPMSYNPFSAHHQQQQNNNSNLIRDHHLNNLSLSSSSHAKNQFVPSIEVNSYCSSSSIVSYSSHCNHHHHHHHLSQQQLQQQSKSFQGQVSCLSTVSPSSPLVGCHSTASSQHPPQTQTLVIGSDGHFYLTPTYPSFSTSSSDSTTTTVQSAYHAHHHHHHPCPHHQHMTHFGCYNNCNCGTQCQSLWMPVA